MKKLFGVIVLALALNFLAAAGGVGWLWRSGHLDKDKMAKIKEMVFPPPAPAAAAPTSGDAATTQPTLRLDDLMAKQSGRPATEQVEFIRRTFDAQMLELDRRQEEVTDLRRQVDLANEKLATDRTALDKRAAVLAAREKEADRLQQDKGFQDSLALYNSMPAKNVKQIFLTLDEQTVEQYLDAMEPRTAAKIVKEFKAPAEQAFIQRVMERMRVSQASATDGKAQ